MLPSASAASPAASGCDCLANPTRRAILDGEMSPPETRASCGVGVVSRARFSDFWRVKSGMGCGTVEMEVDGARGASAAVGPRSEAMAAARSETSDSQDETDGRDGDATPRVMNAALPRLQRRRRSGSVVGLMGVLEASMCGWGSWRELPEMRSCGSRRDATTRPESTDKWGN